MQHLLEFRGAQSDRLSETPDQQFVINTGRNLVEQRFSQLRQPRLAVYRVHVDLARQFANQEIGQRNTVVNSFNKRLRAVFVDVCVRVVTVWQKDETDLPPLAYMR